MLLERYSVPVCRRNAGFTPQVILITYLKL